MWQSLKIEKRFQYFNFETDFLENENHFQKTGVPLKALKLKTYHFHTKLPCQKPMLRQIKWWLQNGPIKENGALPVTTLFFENFASVRTSFKELIYCTNNPNTHVYTFCKRWSFIWRSFFLVSILKNNYFVKHWWTAAFENPVYLNSTEQFPEFQSDEVNRKFIEQGMTDVVKILGFYGDRVFCFPGGGFSVF